MRFLVRASCLLMLLSSLHSTLCQLRAGQSCLLLVCATCQIGRSRSASTWLGERLHTVSQSSSRSWGGCSLMDKLLPISVITSAITGDPESATTVLKHYRRYIAFLASRNGYFDVEASCRMESALLESLFKFDINRWVNGTASIAPWQLNIGGI